MAKITMLSYLPVLPTNSGGRVRIAQLARHLGRRHAVTVICPPLEARASVAMPFAIHECGMRGPRQLFDPLAYFAIERAVRRFSPDCVILEYVWQGAHVSAARLSKRVPVVLDAFDVVSTRFRGSPLWPIVSVYERLVLRAVDRVMAVSENDRAELVALGAPSGRTAVVPNGVDTEEFHPDPAARARVRARLGAASDDRLLLFFGRLDYAPNVEAVRNLKREIMPRLGTGYRLLIAGAGSGSLNGAPSARANLLGPVDRIADYINAADAVLAPITSGSGTRLKVLESVACGAPTVATQLAAQGIDHLACAPALMVARDWDAFADATRVAVGRGNMPPSDRFVAAYDWRSIVDKVELP